jgi:hypothetical protein
VTAVTKNKSKAKAKEVKPEGSKIIEQAVIYVQQMAAYDAGFSADRTGDAEYAGKCGEIKKANRAICKLIGLSPHKTPGAEPLTPDELFAKAGVLAAMYGLRKDEEPNEDERAYIRFFAGEVLDFLAAYRQEAI